MSEHAEVIFVYTFVSSSFLHIQGVTGGMCQTSGGYSLC
jgi:hypothetical protein